METYAKFDRKKFRADFGARLRLIRKKRNMTQETFATLLGTSKQVISRYERGERCPTIDVAWYMAYYLDIPIHDLTGDLP